MTLSRTIVLSALVLLALAAPVRAEDDNDLTSSTDTVRLQDASVGDLQHMISNGYRPIDLEVEDVATPKFSAVLVRNQGEHQKTFWWYYNISAADVSTYFSQNGARIIDLETYLYNGVRYFTVIMIKNSGDDGASWWWYYNITWQSLNDYLDDNNGRPIDVETYLDGGGNRRFAVVMVKNTGDDYSPWWLYSNVSSSYIVDKIDEEDGRLIDMEKRGDTTYTVIMLPREGMGWWWYHNVSSSYMESRRQCNGARFIDVEKVGDDLYYAVMLQMHDCTGDTNNDGAIDVNDLLEVIGNWGLCP